MPQAIDWEEAERYHLEQGLSPAEVARRLGASYTGVLGGLKRRGTYRRPRKVDLEEHRLRQAWCRMHQATTDPGCKAFHYAGALGVKVCNRTFKEACQKGSAPLNRPLAIVSPTLCGM